MFSIFFRRLQKFIPFLRVAFLVLSALGLAGIIFFIEPDLSAIVLAALLIIVACVTLFSFVLSGRLSFLIALASGFFFFLKGVDLLSPINIGMFIVFLVLLGLYLKPEVRSHSEVSSPTVVPSRFRHSLFKRVSLKVGNLRRKGVRFRS